MARNTVLNIPLPKEIKAADKRAIALAIAEYIADRSREDNDMSGGEFPEYTKEYRKKKGQSKVDLSLSDEMLNSMDTKNVTGGIKVGYFESNDQQGKAEGNHYGTYGQRSPISGKKRPFLGFIGKEREQLISIIAAYGDVTQTRARGALKGAKIKA